MKTANAGEENEIKKNIESSKIGAALPLLKIRGEYMQ